MKFLRPLIEFVNRVLGSFRAKRRFDLRESKGTVKVNLGCGLAVSPGWVNVDGSFNTMIANFPVWTHSLAYKMTGAKAYYSEQEYLSILRDNHFVHADLAKGVPFEDSSVAYMFTSHFLEHLYEREAISLLEECLRALEDNGIIRIAIPDLEYAVSLYGRDKKDDMLRKYFFVDEGGNEYSRHKYMYDFEMLASILSEIGYVDIIRCDFQEGNLPDLVLLDNRPDETLFVEARKPVNEL